MPSPNNGHSALIIDGREKGQFPLSIATSLALEGALGILIDKENPKIPPITHYNHLWVNLRTLFRNIQGAVKKEEEVSLTPEDYGYTLMEEMAIIKGVMQEQTKHRVKVFFYACDYKSLLSKFRNAQFKEMKTERQKHYAMMENKSLEILGEITKGTEQTYFHFDTTVVGQKDTSLIVTHYPLDLISNSDFKDVALLESHSGAVKTKAQWHTKLHNGKELVRIPFDRMTIQLFGDSGGLFSPFPSDLRRSLIAVAEKNNWTAMTTPDRVKLTVQVSHDGGLISTVGKLYSNV